MTGYRLTPYNQIDDYGQEKTWKMSKQAPRKRKTQIASTVQVREVFRCTNALKSLSANILSCLEPL